MKTAKATAHSNIALCKYWGKRTGVATELNLPATSSLSMGLDALWTETEVAPATDGRDHFVLNGSEPAPAVAAKVFAHLDRLHRAGATPGLRPPCRVTSTNYLPTAAGLASSASGFAALTLAGAAALELDLDLPALSAMARMGSGSAARSLWGGFVRLDRGHLADGSDCRARPLFPAGHWPELRMMVVQTTAGAKPVGSTEGMERSRTTSPYYGAWVDTSEADVDAAQAALARRDLGALGAVVEHSACKMHACMLASRPPILYWNGATVDVLQDLWAARKAGIEAYPTMDAGPHVKILCTVAGAQQLQARMSEIPGVVAVQVCAPAAEPRVEVTP